jgi:hypothetical protein
MLAKCASIPFLLGLSLSYALLPQRALACSCSISPIADSDPEDGTQNVPLNAALLISGAFRADSLSLQDANGEPVEFTFQGGPWPSCPGTSGELIPKQPLRPNTRYVLKVEPSHPEHGADNASLAFTTGSNSLPDEEPTAPSAGASVIYDVPPDGVSCGNGTVRLNIDVKDWNDVEVVARRGDDTVLHWMLKTGEGGFKLDALPDCVEFRRRARTGRRSSPVTFCGEELEAKRFGEPPAAEPGPIQDASASNERDDAAPASDSAKGDGCSSAPGTPATALPALIALIGMALRGGRRE